MNCSIIDDNDFKMVTPQRQQRHNYSFDDQENYFNKTTKTDSEKDDEFTNASNENDRISSFVSKAEERSLWR